MADKERVQWWTSPRFWAIFSGSLLHEKWPQNWTSLPLDTL